ncbi:MAG: hypothetical protein M1831_000461 [Alyxoria varia]|nr:MAG: hypothetical protein M1831_000461 [Alyxoria varia]
MPHVPRMRAVLSTLLNFLKTVKPFTDRSDFNIAIKARVNQPFAGAANVAHGITVDRRGVKNIGRISDDGTVSRAAGVSRDDLYTKLGAFGFAVAGGRSSQGAIGGLALGGNNTMFPRQPPSVSLESLYAEEWIAETYQPSGFSSFSTWRGFVSDNVANFQVVLASGEIVNANADELRELWIALEVLTTSASSLNLICPFPNKATLGR